MTEAFIVAAKRTPTGAFQGALSAYKAPLLGAHVIKDLMKNTSLESNGIDEVLMGCVLSAGVGQAPARQAAMFGGLSPQTPCTMMNKVCGSGMKTIIMGMEKVLSDPESIILSGGMESMTNAPYLLEKARSGYRLGHGKLIDHMFFDGLEDPYHQNRLMGTFAEDTAAHFQITREEQDAFAIRSYERALTATQEGAFTQEIAAFENITQDEPIEKVKPEKIPLLKPVFRKDGTVTSATSSSIADGAAAVVIMSAEKAMKTGCTPLVRLRGAAGHAHEPQWFTTAPIHAIQKLCQKLDWPLNSVDLFEINEAFAIVTMVTMRELGLSDERVNIQGGACSLGHPIGSSGARIVVTLAHTMMCTGAKRGIAAVCIGGGEALAIALEVC